MRTSSAKALEALQQSSRLATRRAIADRLWHQQSISGSKHIVAGRVEAFLLLVSPDDRQAAGDQMLATPLRPLERQRQLSGRALAEAPRWVVWRD
jgi:hypothetical protein